MAGRMIWHDTRLRGAAPAIAPNIHVVDKNSELSQSILWIAHYARTQGGLDELMIMCHGFEAGRDLSHQMSTNRTVGGFGLEICKQGLDLRNVGIVRAWNASEGRLINKVTVYACAAADTGPGNEGTRADGRRFMGEFAIHSGAFVVAARDTQFYNGEATRPVNPLPIDFGGWEGPVFLYDPKTGARTPFQPGPMA